jgi:hypothetical protein
MLLTFSGGFMKSQFRRTLPKGQQLEYRRHLLELSQRGASVGEAGDFTQRSQQVLIEQPEPYLATLFDLPGDRFVFVSSVRITVPQTFLVADFEMDVAWDERPLDLEGPDSFPFYQECISGFYPLPLTIINPWVMGQHQLSRGQREGLIIASGQGSIPSSYLESLPVTVNLHLRDEYGNENSFTLEGNVDRYIRRKFEQKGRQRRRDTARQPLFGPDIHDLATERTPLNDS